MWLLALILILVLVLVLIVTVHIVAILSLSSLLLAGCSTYFKLALASSLDKLIFFLNGGPRKNEKTRIKKQKNVSNSFDDTNLNKSTR